MSKFVYTSFSTNGSITHKPLSNSSRLILLEAEKYGVTWEIIPNTEIITLTYKGKQVTFYHQVPFSTSALARYFCANKKITTSLLQNAKVMVPKGYQVTSQDSEQYLKEAYAELKKPLVVKPATGDHGDNITMNVTSYAQCQQALKLAFAYSPKNASAIVEEMFVGDEYRILATQDKVVAILNRVPANVVGDGEHTVKQLIVHKNTEAIRIEDGTHSHLQIKLDDDLLKNLAEQNLTLETVLAPRQQVFLRKVSNISKGGDGIDYTELAHPSINAIAMKAMKALPGLSFAGIDFMTKDITKPQTNDSYVIIEVNDSPGFDIHDSPYVGKNRQAAREFLYLLFPQLRKRWLFF